MKVNGSQLRAIRRRFEQQLRRPGLDRLHYDSLVELLEAYGLSHESAKWAIQACDPTVSCNHVDESPVGVPDSSDGSTIVHSDHRTVTLTSPTAAGSPVLTGSTWDVAIAVLPFISNDPGSFKWLTPGVANGPPGSGTISDPYDIGWDATLIEGADTGFYPGLVVVNYIPTGSPAFAPSITAASETQWFTPRTASTGPSIDYGKYLVPGQGLRLAGMSIKVDNVTPELYKSGTVTGVHLSRDECLSWFRFQNGVDTAVAPAVLSQLPPTSIAQMRLLGGVTLPADEGGLMVSRLLPEEPMKSMEYNNYLFRAQSAEDAVTPGTYVYPYACSANVSNPGSATSAHSFGQQLNTHGMLMRFSGLSQETVLSLNIDAYVEQRVKPDSALATVAKPSTPYDPRALQLVDYIQKSLPPIVHSHENAFGDWFKKVGHGFINFLDNALPVIGTVVTTLEPELAPAFVGAQAALDYANRKTASKKKKKPSAAAQKRIGKMVGNAARRV